MNFSWFFGRTSKPIPLSLYSRPFEPTTMNQVEIVHLRPPWSHFTKSYSITHRLNTTVARVQTAHTYSFTLDCIQAIMRSPFVHGCNAYTHCILYISFTLHAIVHTVHLLHILRGLFNKIIENYRKYIIFWFVVFLL